MFRSVSGGGQLSDGRSASSPTPQGDTSPGLDSQESSWIGLLSAARSYLHKYLPGWPRANRPISLKSNFVDEEREFLRQLDDMMPLSHHAAPHVTYLQCQLDPNDGPLHPAGGSTVPWHTPDSPKETAIPSAEDPELNPCHQSQMVYLSSVRTFLSHIWLSSVASPEIEPAGWRDWVSRGGGGRRWGTFWGNKENPQKGLFSDLSWAEEGTMTVPAAQKPDLFAQNGSRGWTLGENTGPTDYKDKPANNGGLQFIQSRVESTVDHRLSITDHTSSSGESLLTPDQDNGYSSLEEEYLHMCALYLDKAAGATQPLQGVESPAVVRMDVEEETPDDVQSSPGNVEEEEEQEAASLGHSAEVMVLTTPQCQNKNIAFIMGCPCSDDDSTHSEGDVSGGDDDDDDDDGFDSKCSSLSNLSDEDDDDDDETTDSEADLETERLWSSLSHSVDPYNPRNFTARQHTGSTLSRTIPTSTLPSATQSTPASSPELTTLPLCSPPSGHDIWDDSTSASEVDEDESLSLWSSFSCSSDPYCPLNFQAPLRTRGLVEAGPQARTKKAPHHGPESPPKYRKEEVEKQLDSSFCQVSKSSISTKKVSVFSVKTPY